MEEGSEGHKGLSRNRQSRYQQIDRRRGQLWQDEGRVGRWPTAAENLVGDLQFALDCRLRRLLPAEYGGAEDCDQTAGHRLAVAVDDGDGWCSGEARRVLEQHGPADGCKRGVD